MYSIFALSINNFIHFLVTLFLMVLVVLMCYYTTKFIAKYQKGVTRNGNIEVIEAKAVGPNKSVEIVRIGKAYYALAVSKDNVSLIDKLDEDQIDLTGSLCDEKQTNELSQSFGKMLEKIKDSKRKK